MAKTPLLLTFMALGVSMVISKTTINLKRDKKGKGFATLPREQSQ